MERFGSRARAKEPSEVAELAQARSTPLTGHAFFGKLLALSLAALCYGLINFGLLLWMPSDLVAKGYSMKLASGLLSQSALIALPTVFAAAWAYSRWSTKWSVAGSIAITILGLILVLRLEFAGQGSPVIPVALLIIGTNALIAMLLPYTAESFPLRIRGRTTGVVAACSKGGGLLAQVLAVLALVPALGLVSVAIVVPTLTALALVAWYGKETRGRDLRDLDPDGHTFDKTGY
jgi:putative MFS transporter